MRRCECGFEVGGLGRGGISEAVKDAKGVIFNFGFLIFPAFSGRALAWIIGGCECGKVRMCESRFEV